MPCHMLLGVFDDKQRQFDPRETDWNSPVFYNKRIYGLYWFEAVSSLHIPYSELAWFISYSKEDNYVIQVYLGQDHKQYRFCSGGIWEDWISL